MSVTDKLKQAALERAENLIVADVRIGLNYTAVQLENGATGLGYTFRDALSGGCAALDDLPKLAGSRAAELLTLFDSQHLIARALALATANALFNDPQAEGYLEGPALEQIDFSPNDQVAMIGHFSPLVKALRPRIKTLLIFEQQARPHEQIHAITEAKKLLPSCQVALITATAIINNSIDALLALTQHCREVVILGSSTPLCAAAFQDTPVSLLSGICVHESKQLLRIVSEAGGTPAFKGAVTKVNLKTR